jgi:hypothetical protein
MAGEVEGGAQGRSLHPERRNERDQGLCEGRALAAPPLSLSPRVFPLRASVACVTTLLVVQQK